MATRRTWLIGLAIGLTATVLFFAIRTRRDFVDFEVYRTAASRAISAEPLYRPDDGHYQFKYWPVFALAMSPFAVLPDEVAKLVWFLLSIALFAAFVSIAITALPDRQSTRRWLVTWTLVVTAKFIVKELVNGQTNVLLGLLVLLAALAVERRRPWRAGVLTAAAVFIKPYALLMLPWLAITAGAASVGLTVGGIAAGLLLPALVYGWTGNFALLREWLGTVTETTGPNLLFPENISFLSMWAKWIGPGPAASGLAAAAGIAGLGLAAVLWVKRPAHSRPVYLEAAFLLLLMPLLSPQGWDYVLLLAVPAFVCLLDRYRTSPALWRGVMVSGFMLTSLTIFDLLGRRLYFELMGWSVVSVGTVLLLASLARLRFRQLA